LTIDQTELEKFESRLGYQFSQRDYLLRGLTHKSFAHEAKNIGVSDNETYEFLGDAVLGFLVGDLLFHRFPSKDEGALSKMKAYLVSATLLARKARDLGMGEMLRLGVGEERSGGRKKDSLLANLYEAVVAALYIDGGVDPVARFVREQFTPELEAIADDALLFQDYKTSLQELAQGKGLALPEYSVIKELGPDHDKRFVIEVKVSNRVIARGEGSSKKEAQQQAAKEALRQTGLDAPEQEGSHE